jgi:hypothetical protein
MLACFPHVVFLFVFHHLVLFVLHLVLYFTLYFVVIVVYTVTLSESSRPLIVSICM